MMGKSEGGAYQAPSLFPKWHGLGIPNCDSEDAFQLRYLWLAWLKQHVMSLWRAKKEEELLLAAATECVHVGDGILLCLDTSIPWVAYSAVAGSKKHFIPLSKTAPPDKVERNRGWSCILCILIAPFRQIFVLPFFSHTSRIPRHCANTALFLALCFKFESSYFSIFLEFPPGMKKPPS